MPDNLTTRSATSFSDMDTELKLIGALPKDVQDWVLFNAPVSLDVLDLIDEHRRRMQSSDAFFSGRDLNPGDVWRGILIDLKNIYYNEAVELYGDGYPFVRPKLWVRRQVDSRPRPVVR